MSVKTRVSARCRLVAADCLHRVRVAFVRRTARARTLAVLLAVGFALLGVVREFPLASFVFQQPFDLDWALRTLSLGWYEPDDTLPVTIVDIDEATYRGWQSPAITPRGELARLIEVVTSAKPSVVVVDIDLSGRAATRPRTTIGAWSRCWRLIAAKRRSSFRSAWNPVTTTHARPQRVPTMRCSRQTEAAVGARDVRHRWRRLGSPLDGMVAVCANGQPGWLPAVPIRVVNALADAARTSTAWSSRPRPLTAWLKASRPSDDCWSGHGSPASPAIRLRVTHAPCRRRWCSIRKSTATTSGCSPGVSC